MTFMDENQKFLALIMATITVTDDLTMSSIRQYFMKRDRQWTEAEAQAEYRYRVASAICKRAAEDKL